MFGSLHPAVTLGASESTQQTFSGTGPSPSLCARLLAHLLKIPFTQLSANVSAVVGDMPGLLRSNGC